MTYEHNKTCPGCFSAEVANGQCENCGYSINDRKNLLALPEHTVLIGKYVVGKVLGVGGFGITYLSLDLSLNKLTAIKEYLPREIAGREAGSKTVKAHTDKEDELYRYGIERFMQEAQTLARFEHESIVRVREVFQENGTCYIVMDYYKGKTLDEYMKERGGRIEEKEAIGIMVPILDGLSVVHGEGVLHRDIKPQNIYIREDGRGVLIDFGSARQAMGERSRSLSVVLTPGYAPYEQYQSRGEQGVWTDIYGVGATMYHMLTGEVPPDAVERRDEDRLIPPKRKNPSISEQTNKAIMKALAVYHKNRQKSAKELKEMLIGANVESSTDNNREDTSKKRLNINKKTRVLLISVFIIVLAVIIVFAYKDYETKRVEKEKILLQQLEIEKREKERRLLEEQVRLEQEKRRAALEEWQRLEEKKREEQRKQELIAEQARQALKQAEIIQYEKEWQASKQRERERILESLSVKKVGDVYYIAGEYNKAVEQYYMAISINPKNYKAYINRGNAYFQMNYLDRAIDDYSKAIDLMPNNGIAYNNRGYVLEKMGKPAMVDYIKACKFNKDMCSDKKSIVFVED